MNPGRAKPLVFLLLTSFFTATNAQQEPVIVKDLIYATVDGMALKLDMARPVSGSGPFPAVLHFHGGGWQAGDKSHGHNRIMKLARSGYVAVSVQYSFAPEHRWPQQVYDAKAAVRYLRQQAAEYCIDTGRIGAVGDSAGGYLALMLGLTNTSDHLEGDARNTVSSHVNAVVTFCSAGDFTRSLRRKLAPELDEEITRYYKKPLRQVLEEFTGTTDPNDPKLVGMSAKSYVSAGDSPVLIFQGDSDPLISMDQVEDLDRRLKAAGVVSDVIIVKGGGHGWYGEQLDETENQMIGFFDRWLK